MRKPYHMLVATLGISLFAGACSDPNETTTGTTTTQSTGGTGGTGAAGGGAGGEGGGATCVAPFITKGPWVLAVDGANAEVRWEACDESAGPDLQVSVEGAGMAAQTVTATVTTATLTETYKAALNPDAPPDAAGTYYLHHASLKDLAPGTCYTYALAADAERKGRFCTARPSGEAFSFLAIGDTNPGLGHTKGVLESVLPEKPEFTLHGGDIQYYDSGLETWASWFPVMQPMLSAGAFFPAIGNHESEKSDELANYALRFFGGAGFDGGETYYRFETGGVHFFSLNTEESIGQGSAQATWLESRLGEVSQLPGYRFSVVFFHRPLVTCGDTGDDPAAMEFLAPIFAERKVALVLQAHMHGYERFDIDGITYMTAAGGGGLMGDVDENVDRAYCDKRLASAPAYHGVIFEVTGTSLVGTAIDEAGTVIDTFSQDVP
ncbi:MAG: metallophosphoesterase [Polyangiaceae bacterium]